MTKKQLVDNYLSKNAEKVEMWRNTKDFSWKEVAEDLGNKSVDGEYIRSRYKWFRKKGSEFIKTPLFIPSIDEKKYSFTDGKEDKSKGTKEFTFTADNIPTEEEIISHFNIDTTKYRINQIYHKTSFGGKYAITVSLLANKGNQTIDLGENFISQLNLINIMPTLSGLDASHDDNSELFNDRPKASIIIPKQDAHWNKADIDGNNSIEDRFASFTKALLNQLEKAIKVNQIEEILYIVGSDEFNSEWTSATTKGTPQQDSISYTKSFEKISEFNIEIIKLLRFYSPKVKVMLLNGNHDHNVSWHLAHLLKHVFSKNEAIEINDSLENTKFYSYKGTLTLLNHGDAIKPKDLAAKFPILAKEQWSNHTNFMVLTGDKHHEVAHDFNGVVWYQVPQLSPARSKWDDKCGHGTSKPELLSFILEECHLSNIFRTPIK